VAIIGALFWLLRLLALLVKNTVDLRLPLAVHCTQPRVLSLRGVCIQFLAR
jgi:hypothetical protein